MVTRSMFRESMAAHALRFDKPLAPAYGEDAGNRMSMAFLIVGIAMLIAMRIALDMAGAHGPWATLALVVAWLAAFVLVHRWLVRVPLAAVGLRGFGDWTLRERLYFLEVVPLAVLIFALVFRARLHALIELHGIAGFVLFSVAGGLIWGIGQELVYRGWLQTELTRRLGPVAGLLVANLVFTFGPLHFDYFGGASGIRWGVLAAIFGVGLLFGFLYARSGNVWIPAVMHGLWPLNMT